MFNSPAAHRPPHLSRRLVAGGTALATVLAPVLLDLASGAAFASTVNTAVFSGGTGTASVAGTLFAKQGAALTLTVGTAADAKCVTVTGATTSLPPQTSSTAKSSWIFNLTAPAGDGAQAYTVAASPDFNATKCTGQTSSTQASYTVDNTGPAITPALTPAANAAGWNNSPVTVKWTATDTGSGVVAGQPFQSDTISADGIVTKTAPAQVDRVGNTGAPGSVTVRLDQTRPTIGGTETKNTDGTSTVTFSCADGSAGSGVASCVADGTSPASSSRTVAAGATVTGTATDTAGNTATASFTTTATPKDTTAPTIGHAVTPAPNPAGWNNADATVTFSCADETGGSGMASCVADGTTTASRTISTETNGTQVTGTATDKAGNRGTDSVTVKLDKTAPTVTASKDRAANANGWYKDDVTVSFAGTDTLSGVASKTADRVLGEGANQSASGTATDAAGNTSAPASVTGVNVDKTAPTLSGAPTASANGNGWYNGDVTVRWTAADQAALSGLAGSAPTDSTITGEGSALTASATVSDKAGNVTSATSPAVKIDRQAPTTGISGTSNAWTNGNVAVSLIAHDNLSGVASTRYSVDGGPAQTGTGFSLSTDGDHTVAFSSTDNAGNTESTNTVHVKIDKTAPTIGHVFTPQSYVDGAWSNGNVGVAFRCADQGGSGVASCTGDATLSTEGASQKVTGTATDGAGNTATNDALVSIDKTAPSISGSADRKPNADGWYNDDVTVSFSATDNLSGVASKTADRVLVEGDNQSVTGTATDAAGNAASSTVSGIRIDKTAPVLMGSFSDGWHTGDVTVAWTCTDTLSGPAAQPASSTVTGEGNDLSATATCRDRAGNSTTTTVHGIQIDRTAPSTGARVTGSLTNGWYNADVSFTLAGSDNLSGVASTVYSVDGGTQQPYSGDVNVATNGTHTVTFWSTDGAGNVEDKTGNSITLKLDKTPPTLTGAPTTSPNSKGWYAGDVTVRWTAADQADLSGLAGTAPADSTITGEGGNLGASASVSDLAGNTTNTTVGGVRIDRTKPTTTADVPKAPAGGWYRGAVLVTLTGHDTLSGIDATSYTVDGGTAQAYTGAFSFGTEGTHQIAFWSKDNAGNVETAGAPITLNIDKTAPATTVINPISLASGWYVTSGVPFAFTATDNTGGSGVAATYYTIDGGAPQTYGEPFTATLTDGAHTVNYWSVDLAGNTEIHETANVVSVGVDTTPPTITGATVNTDGTPRAANGNGWFTSDVAVKFTCSDATPGSGLQTGVAGCAGDTTVTNESATQTVPGDAVDVAGNKTHVDFGPVKLDKTAPTLTGAATTDPNAAGWYKTDVKVHWTGQDGMSDIDTNTQPADSTVTGEGSNLGASAKISDNAGNVGNGSISGIKIDRTAPSISGQPVNADGTARSTDGAGWFKSAVKVHFTASDSGSGIKDQPTDVVLNTDGANQSATGTATDFADNAGSATVSGIKIDSSAPQTSADNKCDGANGWCKGNSATVTLGAVDQVGLSGVKEIHYVVNGGNEQVVAGASTDVRVNLAAKSGLATVSYWAVDNAGNVEAKKGVSLKYDNIAPTVTHTVNPAANAAGWNNTSTTVHFDAKDDDGGSGVDITSVSPDVNVSAETAVTGLAITGTAKDLAGNTGTDSLTVKLDKTAPTITGAITAGTKGANGYYTGPVTVHFTCTDALSGIATCPTDKTVDADGNNQSVSGTVFDAAGNTASTTVSGISIDSVKPAVTINGVSNGATYTLGAVPAATCSATDATSGVSTSGCSVALSGGTSNGVGAVTYTATATDNAGNTTTQTGSYKVIYRFDGFSQPINDTAHQVDQGVSIFKSGSTVPAKFQLKKADGTVVQGGNASWLTPAKGSATTATVDETVYTDTATSGSLYKYDTTAQQYIYNWSTKGVTLGYYYRVGVTLDDGQTYSVNLGLR